MITNCKRYKIANQSKNGRMIRRCLRKISIICLLTTVLLFCGCNEAAEDVSQPAFRPRMQSDFQSSAPVSEKPIEDNELDTVGPLEVVFCAYVDFNDHDKYEIPNQLQAVIQNNTDKVIVDAVVAFMAWDSDNQPVKISKSKTAPYIGEKHFENIYLENGDTFGIDNGYKVDPTIDIAKCNAIVVSFKNVDGEQWSNPNYGDFIMLYAGKPKEEESKTYAPYGEVSLVSGGLYTDFITGAEEYVDSKRVFKDDESIVAVVYLSHPNEAVIFDWEFPDGSVRKNDRREDFQGDYFLFSSLVLEDRGYGTGKVTVTLASSKIKLAEYEFEIVK